MTRILRLLLIAAVALPLWQPAAAQEVAPVGDDAIDSSFLEILRQANEEKMSNLNRAANVGKKDVLATPKGELEIKQILQSKNVDENVVVKAPLASSQTICNGTARNLNLPFCGTYFDYGTSSQMIYPAGLLDDFLEIGDKITSLTFYVEGTYTSFGTSLYKSNDYISTNLNNSRVILRIGETADNTTTTVTTEDQMTANRASCKAVFSGNLGIGSNQTTLTITFNKPYKWNGGNLIVDFEVGASTTSSSNWAYVAWYGEDNHESASFYDYYKDSNATSPTSGAQQSFLPKVNVGFLTLSPYDLSIDGNGDFGKIVVNQTGRTTFIVTNTGKNPCTPVVTISGDQAFSVRTNGYGVLAPDESRYYLVSFDPTECKSYTATLTLSGEDEASSINYTINLSGVGSETKEQAVGQGSVKETLPVNLYYMEMANHGQIIYQASDLNLTSGTLIKKITFHANGNLQDRSGGTSSSLVTLKIGETTQSTYSSAEFLSTDGFASTSGTNIYTGTNTVTFVFSGDGYEYKGGNLVVDASCAAGGTYTLETLKWLGVNQTTNVGVLQYGTYASTLKTFLPWITIDCVPGEIKGRDIVVKDPEFYNSISYTWYENGNADSEAHTSNLNEVATDPDQMIAMLREVYTNKNIPGNMKRGFTETGFDDHDNDVLYTGVGELERTSTTSARYKDAFGWNIPADPNNPTDLTAGIYSDSFTLTGTNGTFRYWYMDPDAYKPNEEGVTLLLVEIKDDFKGLSNLTIEATGGYAQLREYFEKVVKSVRVVKNGKRTGEGLESGTLFKIDCEKMNMFYLLAKGQLAWFPDMKEFYGDAVDVFRDPCYIYNSNYSDVDQYLDYGVNKIYQDYFFLGHMFEQFSPAIGNAEVSKDDIYQDMINMQSFGVIHDCPNVPLVQNGHHFMMYGVNDVVADCQDVTDMMFFVPDYRMMDHVERGGSGNLGVSANDRNQDYFQYNPVIQPIMGLYVIRQKEITPTVEADEYYMLNLNWVSNLDSFLPSDQQEFELLEVVVNEETGVESYEHVYYKNAQGQYIDRDPSDPNAQVVDEANRVPIVLIMNPGKEKNYPNVYVKRESSSKQVTYAIRGRDAADAEGKHFLSLQISNQQSYIIPGLDPNEMIALKDASHYSRYNPDNEKNCYSNRINIANTALGLENANITDGESGTKLTVVRSHSETVNGVTNTISEPVAYITFNNRAASNRSITITMDNQSAKSDYPKGKSDVEAGNVQYYAGYHANNGNVEGNGNWSQNYNVTNTGYVDFGNLNIYDNFVVDVADNSHPASYAYRLESNYQGTPTMVYLNAAACTKGDEVWYAWTWNNDNDGKWLLGTAGENGLLSFGPAKNNIKFVRMNPVGAPSWDEGVKWNATVDLSTQGFIGKTFTLNGWDMTGSWTGDVIPETAYSNAFRVPIYKTASKINNAFSLIEVKGDNNHAIPVEDLAFSERVQYSSKTEILRNDVYRWTAVETRYIVDEVGANDAEQDLAPDGIAGNQGEAYTVTMNDVQGEYYYNGGTLPVSSGYAWANFVDYYPAKVAESTAQGEAYIYAPVVETFSVGKNVVGAQRTDYNTYGGPLQKAAVGVLDIDNPVCQISEYSWLKGSDRYAYYTVELPIKTDAVPTGYKIYMIRAWREIDTDLLDEPMEAFADRKSGDYMFEEMLGKQEEGGEYQPGTHMRLGATQVAAQNVNGDDIAGVYRGTFGARKVRTQGGDNDGTIEDLNMNFRVRLYFTPEVSAKGAAPKAVDSDKIYYIAEYTTPFTIKGGISTGLENLNARQVVGVKYYNVAGIESDAPFHGVNIMVTRYSDGSSTTTKILK